MKGLKIRVPDVPAYLAMPRACGANTAPIAFAEVYLALQNGTVEAQENPRSEEHTSELQSLRHLVCRLLLEKKNTTGADNVGAKDEPIAVASAASDIADSGAKIT